MNGKDRLWKCGSSGGLSVEEIGEVLGISRSTVKREWNVAKAWLLREMKRDTYGETPAMAKD
jgi:hypothetical protein